MNFKERIITRGFIEEKIISKGLDNNKLRTRFPPEPNGHLHIGHAKAFTLSFGLVKKYNDDASYNLRFDDTNPNGESKEYVLSIIDDIKWMGYDHNLRISYTSNYFEEMYIIALGLIEAGLAYVDFSNSDEIANKKGTTTLPGTNSIYRNSSIDENLKIFRSMKGGKYDEGSCVLRAKIDMSHPNMIMRDPIIYRIIKEPHHRTDTDWCIYPMYDFAHPLCDFIECITDSLCTLEFEVHRPLYDWVIKNAVEVAPHEIMPEQTEFNRLSIDHTVLSKRRIKKMISDNVIDGWDDPRLLTLKGLRNRGYTPEIITLFCETVGWTKRDTLTEFNLLEATARTYLNTHAKRIMAVTDPIKLVIDNYEGYDADSYINIENDYEGSEEFRKVKWSRELWIERDDFNLTPDKNYHRLKIGGAVRLKGARIVEAYDYDTDHLGNVTTVYAKISDKKVKGTIHWLPINDCKAITINNYDRLFMIERPDKLDFDKDDYRSHINKSSLEIMSGFIENNYHLYDKTIPVQFLRKGYYILKVGSDFEFNRTVTLRESWKKS